MKQVLVGVAPGERSDEAVIAAVSLARRFGAKLELLHVVEAATSHWHIARSKAEGANDDARRAAGESIAAHLRTRRHDGTQLKLGETPVHEFLRLEVGHPTRALLDRAKTVGADVIVLGSHRRRGLLDFGNTVRAVLAKSPVPVWVQTGWARDVKHMLVPIDLSDHSFAALTTARNLAEKFHARLTTLYCFIHPAYVYSLDSGAPMVTAIERVDELRNATRDAYEKRMKEWDWKGVAHDSLFVDDDPVRGILAHQDTADLIVMGTHGVTGLAATVLGSTAYGVMSSARTPVLVLPHPERAYQL